MNIEEIRSYRNAKPFEPFIIELKDGRLIPVWRPERMAIAPSGRIHVYVESKPYLFPLGEISQVRFANPTSARVSAA